MPEDLPAGVDPADTQPMYRIAKPTSARALLLRRFRGVDENGWPQYDVQDQPHAAAALPDEGPDAEEYDEDTSPREALRPLGAGVEAALGGDLPLILEVEAAKRIAGPPLYWMGSWITQSGFGGWDNVVAARASDGRSLVVQWWYWGDQIKKGLPNVTGYGGETKSRTEALRIAGIMAEKAEAKSVHPLYIIETEFNKGGCEADTVFTDYFLQMASLFRAKNPGCQVVFSPGNWGPDGTPKATTQFHLRAAKSAERIGTQGLFCITRMPLASYREGPAKVLRGIKAVKAADASLATKKVLVTDLGFSSYGGGFSTAHPFGGGSGTALYGEQRDAIIRFRNLLDEFTAAGLDIVIYRSLRDSAGMNPANYFGYGERHWGVVTSGGAAKSAKPFLLELASPVPAPLAVAVASRMHLSAYERGNGVACGDVTVTATRDVTLPEVILAARPPGGTRAGGPFLDIGKATDVAVKANVPKTLRFERALTSTDPLGDWTAFGVVKKGSGDYQDESGEHTFKVLPSCTPQAVPRTAARESPQEPAREGALPWIDDLGRQFRDLLRRL